MGLNTRQDVSSNKAFGYNLTNDTFFKFNPLPGTENRKIEVSQNLEMYQIKRSIEVYGKIDIKLNDKVKIFNTVFKVVYIGPATDNPEQLRIREDIENFTGKTVIGLE